MWQRLTERARNMIFFAQEEAEKSGWNLVGPEHLLLGLLRQEDHVASLVLLTMHVDLQELRAETLRQMKPGDCGKPGTEMALTPSAKRVIDLSYDEARRLTNNYIGTEHLLLALLREGEGLAGRVLHSAGVDLETTRTEIKQLQEGSLQKGVATDALPTQKGVADTLRAKTRVNVLEAKSFRPTQSELHNVSQPSEEENSTPGRGDIGVLGNEDGRKNVEFLPDAGDLLAFTEVMSLKDEFAYRDLVGEGKVLLLTAGTGAKFLRKEAPDIYCVRILDGEHAGRIGFVLRMQLQSMHKDDRPFPPDVA